MFKPIMFPVDETTEKLAFMGLACPECNEVMGLGERVIIRNIESHICVHCGHEEGTILGPVPMERYCPHYGTCVLTGSAPKMCAYCEPML